MDQTSKANFYCYLQEGIPISLSAVLTAFFHRATAGLKTAEPHTKINLLFLLFISLSLVSAIFDLSAATVTVSIHKTALLLLSVYEVALVILFFLKPAITKVLHTGLLLLFSAFLASMHYYGTGFCVILWISAVTLSHHYGLFTRRSKVKTSILLISLAGCLGIVVWNHYQSSSSTEILLFTAFCTSIIITAITMHKKEAKISIQDSIMALHRQLNTAHGKIDFLKKQIATLSSPCDLTKYSLTKQEFEIIRLLITAEGTTTSIAGTLGIEKSTVQRHLQNIFTKTGADNRYHLIELCRNNFS